FAQLRTSPPASLAARLEQPFFSGNSTLGSFPRGSVAPRLREGDGFQSILFGEEPSLPRNIKIEPRPDDPERSARQGVVEAHHDLAGRDVASFLDEDLSDDAANVVLHFLDIGLDHDGAAGNDGAGDVGGRGPASETPSATTAAVHPTRFTLRMAYCGLRCRGLIAVLHWPRRRRV